MSTLKWFVLNYNISGSIVELNWRCNPFGDHKSGPATGLRPLSTIFFFEMFCSPHLGQHHVNMSPRHWLQGPGGSRPEDALIHLYPFLSLENLGFFLCSGLLWLSPQCWDSGSIVVCISHLCLARPRQPSRHSRFVWVWRVKRRGRSEGTY